jgi:hypothetical protein
MEPRWNFASTTPRALEERAMGMLAACVKY